MNKISMVLAAFATAGLLNGCILVVHDSEDGRDVDAGWASNYEDKATARRENNAVLADRVSRKLDEVPELRAEDITVSATGEVVTLFGRMSSVDHLERALETARGVEGVERVVSRITLDIRS